MAGLSSASYLWQSRSRDEDVADFDASSGYRAPYASFVPPGLSSDDVTRQLAEEAFSVAPRTVAGLKRYDGAQVASNRPCEDRLVHGTLASPRGDGGRWAAWAVLDGHAGAATADVLSRALVPFVQRRLQEVFGESVGETAVETAADETVAVERAIAQAFVDLDEDLMAAATAAPASKASLATKIKTMLPAFCGSCALLALYDAATGRLHVACTGDSRAVLGRRRPQNGNNGKDDKDGKDDNGDDGAWEAVPLSVDQTGFNADEVARLQAAHPGEEATLVKDGRVLGLAVSRAFGDGRWKWPLAFQQDIKRRFYAPAPLALPQYDVRTPPYLTAEPVVTTTQLAAGQPAFLILASDGLWDAVSSRQAVDLVGGWLDPAASASASPPVPAATGETTAEEDGEAFDFGHFWKGVSWRFLPSRTVVEDANAAVHLIRNRLGGNHGDMLGGRLAFDAPLARNLRDDVTVQVAFFNCSR